MIGAALVGGYLLLSDKPATVATPMGGGGGGYTIVTEGVPESKKDINYTEAPAPDIPTEQHYYYHDVAAIEKIKQMGGGNGAPAGAPVTKKAAVTAKAEPKFTWTSRLMATTPIGATVVAVKHRKALYSGGKKVIEKIWSWA